MWNFGLACILDCESDRSSVKVKLIGDSACKIAVHSFEFVELVKVELGLIVLLKLDQMVLIFWYDSSDTAIFREPVIFQ